MTAGHRRAGWRDRNCAGFSDLRARASAAARCEHGYGAPQGFAPLRERIAHLLIERSIPATSAEVLLTFGANHGLDLIVRHFLEPGDAVFVDSPGYYPLFGKLRLMGATLVPILRTAEGPDLEDFEAKAVHYRPKLFFTQALAHNPTGTSMGLASLHRLLQAAERHGMMVVEDDPFADILPPMTPRLAALDQPAQAARVVRIGAHQGVEQELGVGLGQPQRLAADAQAFLARSQQRMAVLDRQHGLSASHISAVICSMVSPAILSGSPVTAPSLISLISGPAISRVNVAYADDRRFLDFMRGELA